MNKKNGNLKYIILALLVLAMFLIACVLLIVFRSPLASPIALIKGPTSAPTAIENKPVVVATVTASGQAAVIATATAVPSPTPVPPTPGGICGQQGEITLLFSGTGVMGGMTSADAIRVMKIDFDAQKVTIIAFPRDLVVKVTGLESLNIKDYRLGPAFHEKRRISSGTEKDRYIAATAVVAQALYDNFGVVPTHYITVNLEPWARMIDTIGGVQINLPAQLRISNGMYLQAGQQTLDGNLSKEYIRTFTGAGEQDRLQRQNLFVKALSQKVMSGQTLPKIPALLQDFNQAIITDLSPEQLLALSCLSEKIPATYTTFYEVSADSYTMRNDGAMLPNFDKIRLLVKAAFGY